MHPGMARPGAPPQSTLPAVRGPQPGGYLMRMQNLAEWSIRDEPRVRSLLRRSNAYTSSALRLTHWHQAESALPEADAAEPEVVAAATQPADGFCCAADDGAFCFAGPLHACVAAPLPPAPPSSVLVAPSSSSESV